MQIRKGKPPRSQQLSRIGGELSRAAKTRLAWMDFYRATNNVTHTCRHFGISRQTFYRWRRRYQPFDLSCLEDGSHRTRQPRLPTWSCPLVEKVLQLRLQFPRWVKTTRGALAARRHRSLDLHISRTSTPSTANCGRWEKIYNTVRPHQALGYLTPQQFLDLNPSQRKE